MDIQKEIEKINISHAIEAKPVSSLSEILRSLDPEDLLLTASQCGIKNSFIIKRERIIKKLTHYILNRKRIEGVLAAIEPDEYDLFLNLLDRKYIRDNKLTYGTYGYLMEGGIIYSFYDDGGIFFTVPDEIKEVFRCIDKIQFEKVLKKNQLVYKYIMAFINLYGFFGKVMLVEVFNNQNEEELIFEEFEKILNIHLSRQQPFYDDNELLINHYFDDGNIHEMELLMEKTSDLPYYIPDRDDILKYADDSYFEITPQLGALKDFIINNMGIGKERALDLIDDIELNCSMEYTLQDIVYEFERRGIFFKNMEQFNSIVPLMEDVNRNVRTWSNRGYTNEEIFRITGKQATKLMGEPVEITINNKLVMQKVGRNDSCPCGSGKKYKMCCGR